MSEVMPAVSVCHVIGSLGVGGAERQFVNTVNGLNAKGGEQVRLKALILSAPEKSAFIQNLHSDIAVTHIPVKLSLLPIALLKLYRYFKRNQLDVVHSHMFWSNFYCAITLCALPKIKFFTSEHGMNPWKKNLHRVFEKKIISRRAALRFCVSEAIRANRLEKDGVPEKKLQVLTNGTALPHLDVQSDINFKEKIKLLAVGRLISAKAYDELLLAMVKIKAANIDFELNILGDGELKEMLISSIEQLGLNNYVNLQGSQKDVARWYREADIYVMSSVREGQPMALLEAMAYQLPIVSTKVGGIPNTVRDAVEALLVEPSSADAFANAILKIIADPLLASRLAKAARQRVTDDFSTDVHVNKLLQHYGLRV